MSAEVRTFFAAMTEKSLIYFEFDFTFKFFTQ